MNKKIEYNRSLIKKSSRFKTRELYAKEIAKTGFNYEKATPEQLKQVRKKVAAQRMSQAKRTIVHIALSGLIGILITSILVYWLLW